MYTRKTQDEWQVQGYYGHYHGWEMVDCYDNRKDAKEGLKVYRDNEPQYQHRLIKTRVKIQEVKP